MAIMTLDREHDDAEQEIKTPRVMMMMMMKIIRIWMRIKRKALTLSERNCSYLLVRSSGRLKMMMLMIMMIMMVMTIDDGNGDDDDGDDDDKINDLS